MSVLTVSVVAALVTVCRTLGVCICGFVVARYRLPPGGDTWRDLARINAELLSPCMTIAAFAHGITSKVITGLWPVVVLSVVLPLVWLCVGAFGARLLLAEEQRHFAAFAACAVAFPNGFGIPYPLLVGMRRQVPWLQQRGDEYSATVCMLFTFAVMVQIWTIAFHLYGRASQEEAAEALALGTEVKESAAERALQMLQEAIDLESVQLEDPAPQATAKADPGTNHKGVEVPPEARRKRALPSVCRGALQLLNPTLVSLLVALAIALSPYRKWIANSNVMEVVQFIGAAAVPMVLLQLGAGAARPPAGGAHGLTVRSALTIVFLRLIVANAIGTAIVFAVVRAGWLHDRHAALCVFLQCCAPTAANVMLVSNVQRAYIQPTAAVLFLMQLLAIPTMVVSIAGYVVVLS